ncbi:VMS1-like protein [Paramyrothecium foliicola]|nr:VMS1-like protein [Paramyrothecium foliicola]
MQFYREPHVAIPPNSLLQIAVSTCYVADGIYISRLRLLFRQHRVVVFGAAGRNEVICDANGLLGFEVTLGRLGIQGLKCILPEGKTSVWVGEHVAPRTRHLVLPQRVTAIRAECDGSKIISLGVAASDPTLKLPLTGSSSMSQGIRDIEYDAWWGSFGGLCLYRLTQNTTANGKARSHSPAHFKYLTRGRSSSNKSAELHFFLKQATERYSSWLLSKRIFCAVRSTLRPVYDLPPEVLNSLILKDDADTAAAAALEAANARTEPSPSSSSENLVGSQTCSLCGLSFATLQDQRGHLKSDLHHYNLKQKLRGQSAVSEAEFEKLIGDLDESLSGSDSEETEDEDDAGRTESTLSALLKRQAKLADKRGPGNGEEEEETSGRPGRGKPPLIWFSSPLLPEKTYFGLYRAVLTGEEQRHTDFVSVLSKKQVEPISIPKPAKDGSLPEIAYKGPHIFLCMIGGGHFAAMVVSLAPRPTKGGTTMNREATVLAHKTFHRYTTRRKQGGSQSANDNAKGNAHSAGSSIRRYNEAALVTDVRNLLKEWKGLLDTSELLFIRATGSTNRRTLFGPYDDQVLRHNDTRLRGFPFSTRRATQKELMRSFIELTRLKVCEIDPAREAKESAAASPAPKTSSPAPTKPKLSEEEETALLHTSQLQAFVRRSKLPALLSYIKNNEISPDFEFQPPEQSHHAPRPLHLAAAQNAAPLVLGLLARGGASPILPNRDGKMPFELAGDRATRDAFRVARSELGEGRWDWDTAKVPAAMTKAEADKRDEREKKEADRKESERKKAEEERLRSEGPQVPESRRPKGNTLASSLVKTPQERREEEARGLTPEMRMRLERERRARAAEERMRKLQNGGG